MLKVSNILMSYDTDKNRGSLNLGPGTGHLYGDSYDRIFSNFNRDSEINLLEIGVQKGGSLLAWKDYFPNGNILGIDIVDDRLDEYKRGDVSYILSDIKNLELKNNTLIKNKLFDIIIDDGSHHLSDVVFVINNYLSFININGYLIIEDCQNPEYWLSSIKPMISNNYTIESDDMRNINGNYDDFLIIIKRIK